MMKRIRSLTFNVMASLAVLVVAPLASAQSTGFQGFLQRAGSAVSQSASAVLGKKGTTSPAGASTTTGAYFRPISPAAGGQFLGLFDHWKQGDAWPRAAIYFTKWGSSLPCWTARATIWRSVREHVEETFQVCNAPLFIHDDMGGSMQLSATHTTDNVEMKMDGAVNIPGISHADTANERGAGPNPPHSLFALNFGAERNALMPAYHEILLRLMYACGYEDATDKGINNMAGKVLWVQGFDPAGKAN